MLKPIIFGAGLVAMAVVSEAADLPTHVGLKIKTVRASDAIDPKTDLLDLAAIRSEVTPNQRLTSVEVRTYLLATIGGKTTKIGSFYCHTGGPYGPKEVHKTSEYPFVSCDIFPPHVYVPKGSHLTATVHVSSAEGVNEERTVRVQVLPKLH